MSSPPRRLSQSPVRYLDQRSPVAHPKLHTIIQEDLSRRLASQGDSTFIEVLKNHYQRVINQLRAQNDGLKSEVAILERTKFVDAAEIKDRYTAMAIEDSNLARKAYLDDLRKVMDNLDTTKNLLAQKELELKQLTVMSQNFSQQYSMNLEHLVSENNILRNKLMTLEINKNNEVRQAENRKQLEKSRTNGILNYCKENNAKTEREMNELAKQLIQKDISIESFTKQMLKQKKNFEQAQKRYEDRIQKLQDDSNEKVREYQETLRKTEKHQKQQLAQLKKKEMQLIETISRKDHEIDSLRRQLRQTQEILQQKADEVEQGKKSLWQLHEDHAKEMSKVMTESRVKRRSMKNLSASISSLKDLSAEGSSGRKFERENSLTDNHGLHIVPEQIAASRLVGEEEGDDIEMKELIIHYEQQLDELKKNKILELQLANDKIEKLNLSLRNKQQEVLQILQRFSPLMQYRLNSESLQTERKQKIQKHYKADIDILEVMLEKYSIVSLSKK